MGRRTCSPPPRVDDPDNLVEENRRRRLGMRMEGPLYKAGYPESRKYERNISWELALPDADGTLYQDQGIPRRYKRSHSPEMGDGKRRRREENGDRASEGSAWYGIETKRTRLVNREWSSWKR